jgi:hypothetical protein
LHGEGNRFDPDILHSEIRAASIIGNAPLLQRGRWGSTPRVSTEVGTLEQAGLPFVQETYLLLYCIIHGHPV